MSRVVCFLLMVATALSPNFCCWAKEFNGQIYSGEDYLVYLDKVNVTVAHEAETLATFSYLVATSVGKSTANETDILKFVFGTSASEKLSLQAFSLNMMIRKRGGYYKAGEMTAEMTLLDGAKQAVTIHENLTSSVDLLFPTSTSFHCSKFGPMRAPLKSRNNYTATVVFYKLQIQLEGNGTRFLPAYECVGFFTPGIWMGIFMNLILLAIITWGIYMIMSVKTMDRFDDPKGKPISFAGTE